MMTKTTQREPRQIPENPVPLNCYQRNRVGISFDPKECRTEQAHKDACNINNIMAKYQKTGAIEHANRYAPTYGDVVGADFQKAQFLAAECRSQFAELPSSIRNHFENDVAKYLDFVSNEDNKPEMAELGLIPTPDPKPEKEPPADPEEPPVDEPPVSE